MTLPPVVHREELAAYLHRIADWIANEPVEVPEFSIKQWENIGAVHIDFTLKEPKS